MDAVKLTLIILFTGLVRCAWAAPHQVILVGPADSAQLVAFRQALSAQLDPDWQVGYLPGNDLKPTLPDLPEVLWVTLGREALQQLVALDLPRQNQHVLSLYVSRRDFESLTQGIPKQNLISAIYADAPLVRQINLAHLLAPQARRIGVLSFQPLTLVLPDSLTAQAEISNLALAEAESLSKYLADTIRECDILVGTEDPDLFNSINIKPLLMTAYRHNKFLIGPGYGFVSAGSLATTYASQSDTLRELSAWLRQYGHTEVWPAPRYALEFSVVVNAQVARSLNLTLPEENALKRQLTTLEGSP
ncbi:MAG: hypothetical protein IPM37_09765 [Hahellaceae bacterium]|nr:hypothetical protein [Hahellaceae bacterium]